MIPARAIHLLAVPFLCFAQDGVRPVLGGLPYDSGLAIGVEYRKSSLLSSPLDARLKAIGSTKSYEFLEGALRWPRIARSPLFGEVATRYRNYPEEDF
jgi:hypothetical protein